MPLSDVSLDDLGSGSDASYTSDDEAELRLAQQEWEESLQQLQQLFAAVLLPYMGRWMGKQWSYWAYARYMRLGLGKAFFTGFL